MSLTSKIVGMTLALVIEKKFIIWSKNAIWVGLIYENRLLGWDGKKGSLGCFINEESDSWAKLKW